MVAPYPPGIPVVYPGEVVTQEIWEYLERFRAAGRHLHGPEDGTLSELKIIEATD
jgi:arginine/lysine/ornithine decarboxylase